MVRLAGIEPTTPWFVAKYSIQLSYSRTSRRIIASFSRRFEPLQIYCQDAAAMSFAKIGELDHRPFRPLR